MRYDDCPDCGGDGEVFRHGTYDTCPTCHGKGYLRA